MASKVTTLFEDSAKTNALYPRTKVSAVSDGSGNGLDALLNGKQATLISGTNIKTINSTSILGSGNIIPFVGMDSANVISTETKNSSGPITYTATQNCWVYCYFAGHGDGTTYVKIGSQTVHQAKDRGGNGIDNSCLVPLCKGQTIELSKANYHAGYNYSYTAYGVKAS